MSRVAFGLVLLLAGCASSMPGDSFAPVAATVSARTGQVVAVIAVRNAPAVNARVAGLLAHPLSVEAAVGVALLRNAGLQARLAALGLARAELVQAGLLGNPVFAGAVRFPDRLFGLTDVGLGLMQDVTGLILRPSRLRIAGTRYRQAEAEAADDAVGLIADTQLAYYEALAAKQRAGVARARLAAAQAAATLADAQYKAGNIDALDRARARGRADEMAGRLQVALLAVASTREALTRLMGLSGPEVGWHLPAALPDPPAAMPDTTRWERIAVTDNFHLAALRAAVLARAQMLGLARRFGWLTDIQAGVSSEQNPENYRVTGPELAAPLPLFDHGQAARLAAASRLAADTDRLIDAAIDLRSRTRLVRERLFRAAALAAFYRDRVVPERGRALALAMRQYGYMLLGPYDLLRLKQDELTAQEGLISANLEYWTARAELGRALGGDNPLKAPPTATPISHEVMP